MAAATRGPIAPQRIAQRIGASNVQIGQLASVAQPLQIQGVRLSFSVFGQQTKLFHLAERNHFAIGQESPDVQRAHVAGKVIKSLVRPQQDASAVRHMLVAERSGAHGMQHNAFARAVTGLVVHAERDSVSKAFAHSIHRFTKAEDLDYLNILAKDGT